jgi:hypothetical protein
MDAYSCYPHAGAVPEAMAVNIRGKSYKILCIKKQHLVSDAHKPGKYIACRGFTKKKEGEPQ